MMIDFMGVILGIIFGMILNDAFLSPYIENKKVLYCLFNSISYLFILHFKGLGTEALIYAFMVSILLIISIIDYHFYEIPVQFNYYLLILGTLYCVIDFKNILDHIVGCLCVSVFLCIIFLVSNGRMMGGGDVKLMAACGLILGMEKILYAFYFGCVLALIVHSFHMLLKKKGRVVALGPYFSVGILVVVLLS
ncbi:MAG: A24 family peptidase [bacterium]|nr:A24 family peptidase [bacterium]